MTRMLKSLLRLAIAVTERALRTSRRPRCIRGGSVGARAVRCRNLAQCIQTGESPAVPVRPPESDPANAGVNG